MRARQRSDHLAPLRQRVRHGQSGHGHRWVEPTFGGRDESSPAPDPLPLSLHLKCLHQRRQTHSLRLPPVQDRLDDLRRQQGQPEDAAEIGPVDLPGLGKLRDAAALTALQHMLPAMRAGEGHDERAVDARAGGRHRFVLALVGLWFVHAPRKTSSGAYPLSPCKSPDR
jgi:hypothetical protein